MIEIPTSADVFPVVFDEKIRFSDTDRQGHVNNVCFSFFYEAGRAAVVLDQEGLLDPDCFFVIVSTTINFVGELHYPGTVAVAGGIERVGRSSISVRQALFQDGRCVSHSFSTMAQVNMLTRKSQTLSESARKIFTGLTLSGTETHQSRS